MQKVLVTGVNGFVGRHVAAELRRRGITVVGLGGQAVEDSQFVDQYVALDLTQPIDPSSFSFDGIDGVIHLAGLAAVGPSFDEPLHYVATNVGIETNLFEAAQAQGARPRFVIVSSGSLYSSSAELPLTETSIVSPNSPYAVSKLSQEFMASYYGNRGFDCMLARPFNHFGPGQGLGFIAPDLAQQLVAIERGTADHISVGNLDAERDYTDVRDIARAYIDLLDKGQAGELYNICNGTPRSGHELLNALLASSDARPEIIQDPARLRPADNPVVYGSHAKLSEHTGWQPTISFETTAADVLSDWRSRDS
ncbi:MAG: NAD-dependent epimerase/dehydratase [Candidatus Saccharibacteria bacterium]|nr:NAD-dependent epimerase/dehydratase [Candidatus Saccharibacteria bacterium]